jgi:hypothetical protein
MSTNYLVENNVLIPTSTSPVSTVADVYQSKCSIAINANNAFYGTFWLEQNGQLQINNLGAASYVVYDADRNDIPLLQETALTANADGFFRLTPQSAADLIDLTHFFIKVSIYFDGSLRESVWGFNLGE